MDTPSNSPSFSQHPDEVDGNAVPLSRRSMMGLAVSAPILALGYVAAANAAGAQASPCVNLDALPSSQKGMRRALNFKLVAPDPKKTCGLCSFYTVSAGDCGKCTLLTGGAVAAGSVCDSWAKKA